MNLVLERMSCCYPCQCGHWVHSRIPFLFGVYFKADDCILYLLSFFLYCGFHLNVADFTFVFVHYVCFLFLCFLQDGCFQIRIVIAFLSRTSWECGRLIYTFYLFSSCDYFKTDSCALALYSFCYSGVFSENEVVELYCFF